CYIIFEVMSFLAEMSNNSFNLVIFRSSRRMSSDEDAPQLLSSSSSSSSSPPADSHYIGRKEDIVKVGRVTRLLNGSRDVLVLHHQGQLYAMDMRCYHAGGVLQHGDIE
ncbi:hypothetical protein NL108_010060, partial [Boleophthalmus pectinirostris]